VLFRSVLAISSGAPRADAVDPRVPKPLADIIATALAVDTESRYRSATEIGAALARLQA